MVTAAGCWSRRWRGVILLEAASGEATINQPAAPRSESGDEPYRRDEQEPGRVQDADDDEDGKREPPWR
jgi:hypothetical protein